MKPRALDLFCGAGGVCVGLRRAGFDVVGVDIEPQPDYSGEFLQGDALASPADLTGFDFVWASPPCQRYTKATVMRAGRDDYPDLVEPTRQVICSHPVTCIENVEGAPIRKDLFLTLPMFGNFTHPLKRIFECSFPALGPPPRSMRNRSGLSAAGSSRNTEMYHWRRTWPLFSRTHIDWIAENQPDFYRRHFPQLVSAIGHGCADRQISERRKSLGLPVTTSLVELRAGLGIDHIRSGTKARQRYVLNHAVPRSTPSSLARPCLPSWSVGDEALLRPRRDHHLPRRLQ